MKIKIVKFYRSIANVICFIIFGLGALIVRYVVFPFQSLFIKNKIEQKKQYSKTLQKTWQFFVKLLILLKLIKVEVDNIEKIKNIKNSIIVSTHPSFIDILILISIIPQSTCFVAEKLMHNPFFKGMVKLLFIPDDEEFKWVEKSKEMLDKGFNLIIFPMGTRHKKNEFPKIRRGTALITYESKKNINFINIDMSEEYLAANQPFYAAGEKQVIYNISYLGKLNTEEYFNQYQDEVSFKTALTRKIKETLYYGKK